MRKAIPLPISSSFPTQPAAVPLLVRFSMELYLIHRSLNNPPPYFSLFSPSSFNPYALFSISLILLF
ncbi:unnamed protein product [Prunus brigantina]